MMRYRTGALLASLTMIAGGCGATVAPGGSPDASTPGQDSGTTGSNSDATVSPPPFDGGGGTAIDSGIPIRHVVIVVKENHTFDNYFGSFPGANGISQVMIDGGLVTPPHAPDKTPRDLCHEHNCALTDYADGGMNGWGNTAGSSTNGDNLAWAQYQEADIPNYWQYARKFTLGDNFYANELGPSFPGHMFTLAAQAGWATGNPSGTNIYWGCDDSSGTTISIDQGGTCTTQAVAPCFKIPSVPDVLPTGTSWKFYGTSFYVLSEIWSMFDGIDEIRHGAGWNNVVNVSQFTSDITNKTLPNVSWLVDQDLSDEHPNIGGVCAGENWTVGYINQLMQSDYWKDTAIIFTMDDFGGWYDHVKPPRQYGCGATPYGLGFRLPLIIVSPYAKPGFIFHEQAEQASIPKFIETVFGSTHSLSDLDPAAQDGQANNLLGAFDFKQTPNAPLVLQTRTCP